MSIPPPATIKSEARGRNPKNHKNIVWGAGGITLLMFKKYRILPVKDVANFYHSTNKEIIENCVLLEKEGVKKECVLAKIAVQGRVNK